MSKIEITSYIDDELNKIPHPEWLVDELISTDSLALIYGDWGVGKSFFALDLALCIEHGIPFHGMKVKQGHVAYIYSEGASALRKRVNAWKIEHNIPFDDRIGTLFITESINMLDHAHVEAFIEHLKEKAFKDQTYCLIIIDTLAKCFGDGDEDKAKYMNPFLQSCNKLRMCFGAAILIIHHTGHEKVRERGSRALAGGCDSKTKLSKPDNGNRVTIKGEKQKDDKKIKFGLDLIRIVVEPETDESDEITSCVLKGESKIIEEKIDIAPAESLRILDSFGDGGATHGEWKTRTLDRTEVKKTKFDNAIKELKEDQLTNEPTGKLLDMSGFIYLVTEKGRDHLALLDGQI